MSRTDLARYRMEKAGEILQDAENALAKHRFMLSVNRSYYAMFTSAKALLALEEKDSSKKDEEEGYEITDFRRKWLI